MLSLRSKGKLLFGFLTNPLAHNGRVRSAIPITITVFMLSLLSSTAFAKVYKASASKTNDVLTIAVASNFQYPLQQLIKSSPKWQAQKTRIVTASSGTLYSQIINGAPFDVFLSADTMRPLNLENKKLVIMRADYARGKLAIWPIKDNSLTNIELLQRANRVAIANPQLAPFGKAAYHYLNQLAGAGELTNKMVYGTNVTQAFQFVDSGNAQIGLIAESILIQASMRLQKQKYREYRLLPIEKYEPIIQQAAVLSGSTKADTAIAFIEFLRSKPAQSLLTELGYLPISTSTTANEVAQCCGNNMSLSTSKHYLYNTDAMGL